MKRFAVLRLAGALMLIIPGMLCCPGAGGEDAGGEIRPAPYQVSWQDLEFGVIIHFSTNTFLARVGRRNRESLDVQPHGVRP